MANKLQKLEDMLKIVNDGISKEEFVSSFEAVLKQVLAVEEKIVANNKKAIEELRTLITSLGKELKSTSTAHFTEAKDVFLEQISKALQEQESGMKAIKGLLEELEELRKKKVVFGGGGGGFSTAHSPLHESFTMNGTDTSVTLTQAVAAQGKAVIALRYNGQVQDMTTHYTVDGNKISLTFTPEPTSTISVTYIP